VKLLNQDEFIAMNSKKKTEDMDIERRKTRMKFICFGAVVQTGGNNGACKKLKHGFDQRRTENRHILMKEDIEAWENACLENIYYNEIRQELFKKREKQPLPE
jgi:hypothetical protein